MNGHQTTEVSLTYRDQSQFKNSHYFKVEVKVNNVTQGNVRVQVGSHASSIISTNGSHSFILKDSFTGYNPTGVCALSLIFSQDFIGDITYVSAKRVGA